LDGGFILIEIETHLLSRRKCHFSCNALILIDWWFYFSWN